MTNNSRFGSNNNNNKRNNTSSTSPHVVVVKKKKFNFKKTSDADEVKEDEIMVDEGVSPVVFEEPNINENHLSQLKSESEIINLDDDFEVSDVEDEDQEQDVSDATEEKEEDIVSEVVIEEKSAPLNLDRIGRDVSSVKKDTTKENNIPKAKEVVKEKKNFLNDLTIVSGSKDKKFNSVNESSLFLSKKKYGDSQKNQNFFDDDEERRLRSIASIKRAREKKSDAGSDLQSEKKVKEIIIPETITVQELANRMAIRSTDVVKELMKMGMMITATKPIDADTAELVVSEFGYVSKRVAESDIENILDDSECFAEEKLRPRSPVVSVMGHVDHGKTSLLDALRQTDIVSTESGGITQHIGASRVKVKNDTYITFLDTPGHEAFTAMRLRGAQATDMVILVVAADDGVKDQTVEAINHAKAANIPIIVAVNKIDKEGANPSKVINELLAHDVIVESMGGDCLCVEVSAAKKQNLDKIIDGILLQSELLELKANPDHAAIGVVIESKIDKSRGSVVTFLTQIGTLKNGDIVVVGTSYGKVRLMTNDKGQKVSELAPSEVAEILGLDNVPEAGEKFHVVKTEKIARDIVEYREKRYRDRVAAKNSKKTLEDIFCGMTDNKRIYLSLIVKGDVKGSVEAITSALEQLSNDEVKIKIIHTAVGGISDSDISLAKASDAIILGFNVRTNSSVSGTANSVDIRYYSIIYDLIDDVKSAVQGLLAPVLKEVDLGKGEIRKIFDLSKFGKIAGSYVVSGMVKKSAKCRIIRDSVVIADSNIKALKRYKDDVKEVNTGSEFGISFENFTDFKEADQMEFYEVVEEKGK